MDPSWLRARGAQEVLLDVLQVLELLPSQVFVPGVSMAGG